MSEDANRVLSKIYWSVNTTNGKSGVELLWAGSGASVVNATIGFFRVVVFTIILLFKRNSIRIMQH